MNDLIKLSCKATHEFWEIPVLFEDEHVLALNKPADLLTSPDRYDPERPNLMQLLHRDIERGAPWVAPRRLTYLMNAHRLDCETSGVLLLAKSKPVLVALANSFGSEQPLRTYAGLVQGVPPRTPFVVDARLAPHPTRLGLMRVDPTHGKRSITQFEVREQFSHHTLLQCRPLTARPHQIRIHLRYVQLPVAGDAVYGGRPLLLSRLKTEYHLKHGRNERPLLGRAGLHAEQLALVHPMTGSDICITAPWPKDLTVAVKYLRRYATAQSSNAIPGAE